jgi:hypothetical protein
VDARRFSTVLAAVAAALASRAAAAQTADTPDAAAAPLPVGFGADEVRVDARAQALEVSGHVRVEEPPFYLSSDALVLRRVPIGARLDGTGELAFCPCLGTPLAVRFRGATVAPPHDIVLQDPVLEVFGVPVAWAPAFWLRSRGRAGLLPPEIAWRGGDGLFAGSGVHLPWRDGDTARGLDVRAGGYVDGGAAVDTALETSAVAARVRWDRLHGDDGLTVGARGGTGVDGGERPGSVAVDVDAMRGARAVESTTDVQAAAQPFDRADVEASWLGAGWTFASGVRTVALRGGDLGDLGVGGPVARIGRGDAIGGAGTYDAFVEGGQVSGGDLAPATFARAEAGALLAARVGPLVATSSLRGLGLYADDGARGGIDAAGQARAALALPLVRAFASGEPNDPWIHRTEPRLEIAAVTSRTSGVLGGPIGRGALLPPGGAWIATGGWTNLVGRLASRVAADLDVAAGAAGDDRDAWPALRARAAASGSWVALRAELARVAGAPGGTGGAFVGAAQVGPASGPSVLMAAAERDGVDPRLARVLTEGPIEPASGFLVGQGWTGGARAVVPVGTRVTVRGGADLDLAADALVAEVGALEVHDGCRCVVARASVAHRVGREGIDAWVSIDVASAR